MYIEKNTNINYNNTIQEVKIIDTDGTELLGEVIN